MIHEVPAEVWAIVASFLDQKDVAAMSLACRDLRDKMHDVFLHVGVTVRQESMHAIVTTPKFRDLTTLTVLGRSSASPWQLAGAVPPGAFLRPPPFRNLVSLTLVYPRYPTTGTFWKCVFDESPALRHVTTLGDFNVSAYASQVGHHADLVRLGAPRLNTLDIQGGWLVIYPTPYSMSAHADIAAAVAAVHKVPPVASRTLRKYRAACRQVPIGVDAPLDTLVIDETHDPPHLLSLMGPLTARSTRTLVWTSFWPNVESLAIGRFSGLESLDLTVESASSPATVSECIRALHALPPGLRRLRVQFDMWVMRARDSRIDWGRPLGHLRLEALELRLLFPPDTTPELLSGWLGVRSARLVDLEFREPTSRGWESRLDAMLLDDLVDAEDSVVMDVQDRIEHAMRPMCSEGLEAWLDAHPEATVVIKGLGPRLRCSHARCHLHATP